MHIVQTAEKWIEQGTKKHAPSDAAKKAKQQDE
jgi:hypothetical protein